MFRHIYTLLSTAQKTKPVAGLMAGVVGYERGRSGECVGPFCDSSEDDEALFVAEGIPINDDTKGAYNVGAFAGRLLTRCEKLFGGDDGGATEEEEK